MDGLSLLQIFSQMQDSADKWNENRIPIPPKEKLGCCEAFGKSGDVGKIEEDIGKETKVPDKLFGKDTDTPADLEPERVLYVSNDLELAQIKAKAKENNVTINDWYMGCIAKAVKDYYEKHLGGDLPQQALRAETAISTHLGGNLHSFEPSNQLIGPVIIMDFQNDD